MCPFHPGQKVPQDPRKNQSLDTNVLTAGPVSARRAAARLVSVVAVWSQEAIRRPSPASVKVTVLQHPLPPPGGLAGASPRRPLAGLHLSASEPRSGAAAALGHLRLTMPAQVLRRGSEPRPAPRAAGFGGGARWGSPEGRGGAARTASIYTAHCKSDARRGFCLFAFSRQANIILGFLSVSKKGTHVGVLVKVKSW